MEGQSSACVEATCDSMTTSGGLTVSSRSFVVKLLNQAWFWNAVATSALKCPT